MEKLVSVIVPVYNIEKYLHKCIDSIINQTYKNLEIILINDGSKDSSIDICNEYVKKDSRIKVIDKENEGVSVARNLGIEKATGEYLMFVDSDDWLDINIIKDSISKAENNEYDIVLSKLILSTNEKKVETYCYYSEDLNIDENLKEELILSLFLDNGKNKFSYIGGPVSKLIRRDFLIKNNIKFNKNLKYGEDLIVSLQSYVKAEKIYFLNKNYYFYRQVETSATHNYSKNFKKDFLNTTIKLEETLKENGILEKYKQPLYYNRIKILEQSIFRYFLNEKNNKKYCELKKEFIDFIDEKQIKEALENVDVKQLKNTRKIIYNLSKRKLFLFICLYHKCYIFIRKIVRKVRK